jgi:hypothetical protein
MGMKKPRKQALVALLVVFLGIQFVPVERRNPPVQAEQTIFAVEPVPPAVRAVFETSCLDCHSNRTRWPWYSYVAPVSWMVVHDVHEGRSHMNFSEWGSYSAKQKEHRLEAICEQLLNEDMPDAKYTLLHRSARLSHEQRELVCAWIDAGRDRSRVTGQGPASRP